MDALDRTIISMLQNDFPETVTPFASMAASLGIPENELFRRIGHLKETGIIRRIGGIFDSKKLGYFSTLCACRVEVDRIDFVAEIVNGYQEVTHNYIRDHRYNMWFTVTARDQRRFGTVIKEIEQRAGVTVKNMPATQCFKLHVSFAVD